MTRSIADIIASAKRPERVVSLCTAGDLVAEYEHLRAQMASASTEPVSLGEPAPSVAIRDRMAELSELMAAAVVEFRLRAMEPRTWSDLWLHKPDRIQPADLPADADLATRDAHQAAVEAAEATYLDAWFDWICALVAGSCADPVMTAAEAAGLSAVLSNGQWTLLTDTAYDVNTGRQDVSFFGAASANHPAHRDEVEAARAAGRSRSVFLGRQLAETTTYTYADGLLVESVTVREPEWTDEDRAWLLALLANERERCSGCGQPLAECMDPRTQRTWTVVRAVCEACRVKEAEMDNDTESIRAGGDPRRGQKYFVIRDVGG